jgi:uncharacterized membrane protein
MSPGEVAWHVRRNVDDTERTIRAGAGASLLAAGLTNGPPGPGNVAAVAGGGYLVATGVTGRCPAYDLLGVDRRRGGRDAAGDARADEEADDGPVVIDVE